MNTRTLIGRIDICAEDTAGVGGSTRHMLPGYLQTAIVISLRLLGRVTLVSSGKSIRRIGEDVHDDGALQGSNVTRTAIGCVLIRCIRHFEVRGRNEHSSAKVPGIASLFGGSAFSGAARPSSTNVGIFKD
jgi:hypothetical protein